MSLTFVRSTLRPLLRRPGYAFFVIAGLAVGIGANTAIFSLVHGILIQPLPYDGAERLVTVWEDHSLRDGPTDEWTGFATFSDWRRESTSFEELAAYAGWAPNIGDAAEQPEQLSGLRVSHGWFEVLGTTPAIGRSFTAEDDVPGAEQVVMLSHGLWQRRFGGEESLVGRSIELDDVATTVIGVLPESHEPLFSGVEIWRPLAIDPATDDRGAYYLQVVGRLKANVSLQRAGLDMDRVAGLVSASAPAAYGDVGVRLIPLHERVVGAARPALLALTGAVALLLLVTCANVANLLLVGAIGRRQELAIRAGLGASRAGIVGRLLAESSLLAGLGGAAGLWLAAEGTKVLVAMAPENTPRLDEVSMNPAVAGFAVLLTALTGLGFGVIPALRGSRFDLAETLQPGSRGSSEGQSRISGALVVAETALAACLLVGAGLLATSFWNLTRVELGFDSAGILRTSVQLPAARYEERSERVDFFDRLVASLEARGEIASAAAASNLPMDGAGTDFSYYVEGTRPPVEGREPAAWYRLVTPGYFETLGIPILAGRPFSAADHGEAPKVVAVSQQFARRWFGGESPLGKRMKIGSHDAEREWMQIVAVIADVHDRSPMLPTRDDVYLAHRQWGNRAMGVVVETGAGASAALAAAAVGEEIARLDPALSAPEPSRLGDAVRETLWLPRLAGQALAAFAVAALLLAALGLFGVLSHAVQLRRREMGIRAALGADRGRLLSLVLARGFGLAGLGVALGIALSLASSKVLDSLLFGVGAADPVVLGATAAVLLLTAGLAAWIPARRASGADPAVCLRQD